MKFELSRHALASAVFAATLPLLATGALASGTHGGGHGAAKSKIDYAHAEEHEFGKAGDPMKAARTIEIDMTDMMRFNPETIEVKRGDTVRFVIANSGKLKHEMVLGTPETLAEHAKMMQKFPGMEHDEPYMTHVDPGGKQTIGWTFTEAGEFAFACLVPGHFEAGMKGTIIVR